MKKAIIFIFLLALAFPAVSFAATLHHVRFNSYPEKIRAVFDFDEPFTYEVQESKDMITIVLNGAKAGPPISNYVEVNDLIVRYFEIEKEGDALKVTIPLGEPIQYNIFCLNDPPRLVIDFEREFLNVIYGGLLAEGIEHFEVKKGSAKGLVLANVIKIAPGKAEIKPALARKYKPDALVSFLNFFMPWHRAKPEADHFYLDKVSNIVADNYALAGINGTYFSADGDPLGALIIDGELVSAPIYDRSAFFIDENNLPYIDNLSISICFSIKNHTRYEVDGINQNRSANEIILYTPAWGRATGTNSLGMELVVKNSRVTEINLGNSKIPDSGYVLSVNGPALETLKENVKVGDEINSQIKLIPYSTSPRKIVQLISGGPRLLKCGRIYVSKYEEKFKADIAKARAARTAVGTDKQGNVYLVTVDGPSKKNQEPSLGTTLEELSQLMLNLGATEALNLDGGSSSTMIIEDKIINNLPGGLQRSVSNALIVLPKL